VSESRVVLQDLFAPSGLTFGGDAPWDPKVHDERFYGRVLAKGSLGLGESYVDGWWDCEELETFFCRLLSSGVPQKVRVWRDLLRIVLARLTNRGRRSSAFEIGERHYDLGNDLYETMLDRRMTYSCGYWAGARNLDEAQEAKLDLVCRKAALKPGMRVLDIGCGWGSLAAFAAERYGVSVVGITVSKEQIELGRLRTAGLPVQLLLQDYRDLAGTIGRFSTWRAGVSSRAACSSSTRSEPGCPPSRATRGSRSTSSRTVSFLRWLRSRRRSRTASSSRTGRTSGRTTSPR
jgi:cyclopropane-fatty-acyl-phospholipid synthase